MDTTFAPDTARSTDAAVCVYALCEPGNGAVRYIGKTVHLEKRVGQHLAPCSLAKRSKKNSWLKSLHAKGLEPQVRVLEEVSLAEANEAERRWIAHYRPHGRLTNLTDGGDGMCNPSLEIRSQIGWRKLTAEGAREIRERFAAGEDTVALAEEFGVTRHAVGLLLRGKTWPQAGGPLTAAIPRTVSPAALAAAERATKGKPRPPEVRLKISNTKRGQPYPSGTNNPRNAAKVSEGQVLEIRRRARNGVANKELAAWSGLTIRSISNIVSGHTWPHLNEPEEN